MSSSTTRWALVALATVLATVGLSACGTKKLKDKEVCDEVKSNVLEPKGITGATVKCPSETEAKKDAKINCTVTKGGDRGQVTATVLDKDGKLGKFDSKVEDLQRAVVVSNASEKAQSKGVSGDVDCGKGTTPKKGAIYFCTANIKGSGTGVVLVTQKDERGTVDVLVRKKNLTTGKIEKQIGAAYKKKAGIDVTVKCPSKVKSRIGATFTCTVTNPANGRSQTIIATQKDTAGNFSLKIK
jgi:archaellin